MDRGRSPNSFIEDSHKKRRSKLGRRRPERGDGPGLIISLLFESGEQAVEDRYRVVIFLG